MIFPVCSTFMTKGVWGSKTATHSKALYSPGRWSRDLGNWVLGLVLNVAPYPSPTVMWLQTNAGFPSLSTDVMRGRVPVVQWLHQRLFARIADTKSYFPALQARGPQSPQGLQKFPLHLDLVLQIKHHPLSSTEIADLAFGDPSDTTFLLYSLSLFLINV